MIRSLLALTVRSLREDSRSLWPHLFRLLFAAFILGTVIVTQYESFRFSAPGLRFFIYLCWLNFIFITVGAVSVFATPITEEKEEATLGLLRMAGINPVSLLLGKSTTRLFGAVLILAIQFPFMLLAITLGGVLWNQVLAAYLSLLAYLILVAQLGLLCSVMCARSSSAAGLTGLILGAVLGLSWPATYFFQKLKTDVGPIWFWQPFEDVATTVMDAQIWRSLTEILTTGFSGDGRSFQFWSNVAVAIVLFVVAWLSFDFFTRDHLTSVPARGALFRFRSGEKRARRWLSSGRAWDWPLAWKEFHFIAGGFPMIAGKLVGYFVLIVAITIFFLVVEVGSEGVFVVFGRCAWVTMMLVTAVELAIHMSRVFREELKWQTYSALMMLPGTLGSMAWSKVGGCFLSMFPGVFWLGVGIFLDARTAGWELKSNLEHAPMVYAFFFMHYIQFLHLVVWLSLILKWGGLPLAFVINYPIYITVLVTCANAIRMGGPAENVFFGSLAFFCLIVSTMLHAAIWYQLNVHAERA